MLPHESTLRAEELMFRLKQRLTNPKLRTYIDGDMHRMYKRQE